MSNLNLGKLISSAGVKLPAFTTANLPTGELGLLVFDMTENVVKVYNGNAWVRVTQGGQITATGGTEVVSGNYKYHIYGSPGPSSFIVTSGTGNIEVMLVAGGGAGSNNNAGGGGASIGNSADCMCASLLGLIKAPPALNITKKGKLAFLGNLVAIFVPQMSVINV